MTEEKKSMVPKLRFPEFTATWEQHKLGDLGHTYGGLSGKSKQDFGHGDARFVTYMNVFSNPIGDPCMVDSIEIDDRQSRVRKGDVLFTTSSETPDEVGMSCVWPSDSENLYLNSFCFGYRPTTKINSNFLASLLRSPSVREKIIFLAQGISRYNISKNKVMEISIPLPSEEEQSQIGDFFTQLDKTITLHQRKLEGLSKLKKSLLQKMFPKNGSLGPELRFPGFTGDWEQRKLEELASKFTGGGTPNTSNPNYWNGEIPWIQSSDLKEDDVLSLTVKKHISQEGLKNSATKIVPKNSLVIVTRVGVGKLVVNTQEIATSQDFLSLSGIKGDSRFLAYSLYSLLKKITRRVQGTSIKGITKTDFLKETILVPALEEQEKISSCMVEVDKLITLHQRKLESLKKLKKSLLQQMFV